MNRDELEALELLADGLTPVEPSPGTRQRLLDALTGPLRFLPFAPDLAERFDLPLPQMQALLRDIDRPDAWQPGVMPAVAFRRFEAGPRTAGTHAGFVRLAPGGCTAERRHVTRELTYVLRGKVIDSDGRSYGPGEALAKEPGSVHALTAGVEEECWAVVLIGPVAAP